MLSDLLTSKLAPTVPPENHLQDHFSYGELLSDVGFQQVNVEPALAETWNAFRLRLSDFITVNRARYGWTVPTRDLYYLNVVVNRLIREVLLASARKPTGENEMRRETADV